MSLVSKIVGSHSDREIKRIMPLVQQINEMEEAMRAKSDDELRAKTDEFKERLAAGETLDDILPEAFAACRCTGTRNPLPGRFAQPMVWCGHW